MADQLLRSHLQDPLTIREICATLGVPSRTLHLAFLESFGVPPKRYFKILRLHAARNELRAATAHTTVTGVAMHWSFFHLSRFSEEYRKSFGERPSTTLRRHKYRAVRGASDCNDFRLQ
jgi:AraC family ethanolamine operon transcriptional activator